MGPYKVERACAGVFEVRGPNDRMCFMGPLRVNAVDVAGELNLAHHLAHHAARREAIDECVKVVESEEELDGTIPCSNWAATIADPEASLRAAVVATKKSITSRLRALLAAGEEGKDNGR